MTGFWSSETMRERLPDHIEPFVADRVTNGSYELSLGSQAFVTGNRSKTRQNLGDGDQLCIPAGQFALLLTKEQVKVPLDALALISIKSRWKLRGLMNVSGFHVDPGYHGHLLFSVYNAGPNEILLDQGKPLFLIWYSNLDRMTTDGYSGAGKERSEIKAEDIMMIRGDVYTPQVLADRVHALEKRFGWRREALLIACGAIVGGIASPGIPALFKWVGKLW